MIAHPVFLLEDEGPREHIANCLQMLRAHQGLSMERTEVEAIERRLTLALQQVTPSEPLAPIGLDQEMAVLADEGTA